MALLVIFLRLTSNSHVSVSENTATSIGPQFGIIYSLIILAPLVSGTIP
jgi:hypothetical protein